MSERVIPESAIKAALKVSGGPVLAIMNEEAMVRRILEAAAPYMQTNEGAEND